MEWPGITLNQKGEGFLALTARHLNNCPCILSFLNNAGFLGGPLAAALFSLTLHKFNEMPALPLKIQHSKQTLSLVAGN